MTSLKRHGKCKEHLPCISVTIEATYFNLVQPCGLSHYISLYSLILAQFLSATCKSESKMAGKQTFSIICTNWHTKIEYICWKECAFIVLAELSKWHKEARLLVCIFIACGNHKTLPKSKLWGWLSYYTSLKKKIVSGRVAVCNCT